MADKDELLRVLGQLEGKVDSVISNQARHDTALQTINTRMGKVEVKAATNGAVAGGIFSLGVTLLAASVRQIFKSNGVG